jgi:hypothetical protein
VHAPECDVSSDKSLMMCKSNLSWKVHIPSKHAKFHTKSFELCKAYEVFATGVAAMFLVE